MKKGKKEVQYLKRLQQEEKQRAKLFLEARECDLSDSSLEAVTDLYCDISSRLRIVEEYLVSVSPDETVFSPNVLSIKDIPMPKNKELVKIAVANLPGQQGLGSIMHNAQGLPYRWLDSGARILAEVDINRSIKMTLAIDFEIAEPSALLNDVQIIIDGVVLKHKTRINNKYHRLLAHIPKRKRGGSTAVEIKAPKYGINNKLAMSDIYCVPTLNIMQLIKKKVTSK